MSAASFPRLISTAATDPSARGPAHTSWSSLINGSGSAGSGQGIRSERRAAQLTAERARGNLLEDQTCGRKGAEAGRQLASPRRKSVNLCDSAERERIVSLQRARCEGSADPIAPDPSTQAHPVPLHPERVLIHRNHLLDGYLRIF